VDILDDVPIKVGDLYVPIDFVILEMEEDMRIPIILRRPFLATNGYHIDVKTSDLLFVAREEHVKFNLFRLLNSLLFSTSWKTPLVNPRTGWQVGRHVTFTRLAVY